MKIEMKTIYVMQNNEKRLIIMNLMIHNQIEFLRMKNRINVTFFRTMNNLFIVEHIKNIMKQRSFKREHFDNVITHFTKNNVKINVIIDDLMRNQYVSTSLKKNNMQNQQNDKKKSN